MIFLKTNKHSHKVCRVVVMVQPITVVTLEAIQTQLIIQTIKYKNCDSELTPV